MPYKDPDRKRQWESEHRQQRNLKRRMQRITARSGHENVKKPVPDPVSDQNPQGTWKTFLGWTIGIGVVLLAAFAGIDPPQSPPSPRL
jgi:hypothetical protein